MAPTLLERARAGESLEALATEAHAQASAAPQTFVYVTPLPELLERCREQAALPADQRGLLWGHFFAAKDNIDIAGQPTTAGCPAYKRIPITSGPAVTAILAQGGINLGKTNMDQFAAGLVGTRSPYGVPENHVDKRVVPGGSSSGSASAAASGVVTFAMGTDTAGSGRVPAGFQGIYGIKPSVGLISTVGVVPACASIDCVSIFCADLDIGCLAAKVMADHCRANPDMTTRPLDAQTLPTAPERITPFYYAAVDAPHLNLTGPRGEQYVKKALDAYGQALVRVNDVGGCAGPFDFAPFLEAAKMLYGTSFVAERYAGIREFLESGEGAPVKRDASGLHVDVTDDPRLLPVTRTIVSGASKFSAADLYCDQAKLDEHRAVCAKSLTLGPHGQGTHALAFPTITHHYTVAEVQAQEGTVPPTWPYNSHLGLFTNFVNLMGLCAISVPVTEFETEAGAGEAPLRCAAGITLVGPPGTDAKIWQIAKDMATKGSGAGKAV